MLFIFIIVIVLPGEKGVSSLSDMLSRDRQGLRQFDNDQGQFSGCVANFCEPWAWSSGRLTDGLLAADREKGVYIRWVTQYRLLVYLDWLHVLLQPWLPSSLG